MLKIIPVNNKSNPITFQVSNGSYAMTVELFPLGAELDVRRPPALGDVHFAAGGVLPGEVTDDLCRSAPCHHGLCRNTWNDFTCVCPRGYKGKMCQDTQFCEIHHCPTGAVCQNLDDGYECLANTTFQGDGDEPLAYVLHSVAADVQLPTTEQPASATPTPSGVIGLDASVASVALPVTLSISYRAKVGGTMFYVRDAAADHYFGVAVFESQVTVQWRLNAELPVTQRFDQGDRSGTFGWERIFVRLAPNGGRLEGGFGDWHSAIDPNPAMSAEVSAAEAAVLQRLFGGTAATAAGTATTTMYVGGIPHSGNESGSDGAGAGDVAVVVASQVGVDDSVLGLVCPSQYILFTCKL